MSIIYMYRIPDGIVSSKDVEWLRNLKIPFEYHGPKYEKISGHLYCTDTSKLIITTDCEKVNTMLKLKFGNDMLSIYTGSYDNS